MSVPSYLIREAFHRLSDDPVRQLVKKAGIDPDLIPGPEPDLDGIRNAYGIQGVPTDVGSIIVEGSMSLLGAIVPIHFRVTYAGEFGHFPQEFEGFGRLGVVQRLELLTWDTDAPAPVWSEINIALVSPEMLEAIDGLILKQVAESRGLTFL